MNRPSRVGLLLSLYFAQGLPFGLFTQALPVFMREAGHSLEHIGLSNLLALPWALKFLWAPVIDRVPGHRRRVILPLNIAAATFLVGLSQVAPGSVGPLVLVVFLCNLAAATQDIATDGYAVELLDERDRGLGNGVQVAGYRLGMVVGGGVLLAAFASLGWSHTFLAAATLLLGASLPLWFAPAAPREAPPERPSFAAAQLHRWFAEPGAGRWLALLVAYKVGDALGTGMVKPMLVDMGQDIGTIGRVLGLYGSLAGMTGALLGGLLVQRLGRRLALSLFAGGQVLTMLAYAGLALAGPGWLVPVSVAEHFCSGMATAALFTAMMDACRRDRAGVDYTVQASVVVIAQGLGAVFSGYSAARLGYAGHFAFATALCLWPLWLVLRWPREAPPRFGLR